MPEEPDWDPQSADEQARNTRLAGELLAWLDEKDWTDDDKVCVCGAVFPVLLARMSKDKEKLDKAFEHSVLVMKVAYELLWKGKEYRP